MMYIYLWCIYASRTHYLVDYSLYTCVFLAPGCICAAIIAGRVHAQLLLPSLSKLRKEKLHISHAHWVN